MFAKLMFCFASILVHSRVSFCASNESSGYVEMDQHQFRSKDYRFIKFNTEDSGDVTIELAFNVPFITIPTKKAVNTTKNALATVNVGSIVLGGAVVLGIGVAAPAIYHLLTAKNPTPSSKAQRSK